MKTTKKIILNLDTFFKVQCSEFFRALGAKVETEIELFKQPKRLDVLVIKQHQQFSEKLYILDYFQKYNLISYKSFHDHFSIDDIRDAVIYFQSYLNLEKDAHEKNSTITLIVSRRPLKFLKEVKSNVTETLRGRYMVQYPSFKLVLLNLEEIALESSLDGIFLSEFVKDKNKITDFSSLNERVCGNKKIVDILQEGIIIRLVTFEEEQIDMGAVADITKYVLPELEKAEEKGIEKGITEGKIQIVQNMREAGFSISDIAKATKLSLDKINKMLTGP